MQGLVDTGVLTVNDEAALPKSSNAVLETLTNACGDDVIQPQHWVVEVCRECGTSWYDPWAVCRQCKKAPTEDGHQELSFHVWPLPDLVRSMVEDPEHHAALLDHTNLGTEPASHPSLGSDRYLHAREELDKRGPVDARHVVLKTHHDSFCPFSTRPQHSCGYVFVQPHCSSRYTVKQESVKLWIFIDGPHHLKNLEPVESIMYAQTVECLESGVQCSWPKATTCVYSGNECTYDAGPCTIRALVGSMVNDQPAGTLYNGHASHTAMMGCRLGSNGICKGSAAMPTERGEIRTGLIGKGKSKVGKKSKKKRKCQDVIEEEICESGAPYAIIPL